MFGGFRRLQTRLTVLYATLFGVVLVVLAATMQLVISGNARREVSAQLQSSGAVFQRVWSLQAQRLQQGGEVLAQDFGFRQAVATGDALTTRSALDNLQARLKVDRAVILGPDGAVMGEGAGLDGRALAGALDPQVASTGVLVIGGQPYMAVAAPVLAPDPHGWVIFALKLDRAELAALEKTAAIPLNASIVSDAGAAPGRLRALVRAAQAGKASPATEVESHGQPAMALVAPLARLEGGPGLALSLSYPLDEAMAPYQRLRDLLVLVGLLGGAVVLLGGWFVARGVTQPVRALDTAVQALGAGAAADIAVSGRDELARLGASFNAMTRTIREREAHISRLAYSDVETSLGNRRALERAIADRLAADPRLAVGVFAINRFAHVRGAIGHALAHDLVRATGERLAAAGCQTVARLTTATLGFTFPAADEAHAYAGLARAVEAMRAPFPIGGTVIDVTGAAGFVLAPPAGASPEVLIERASIALDQAGASQRSLAAYDAAAYGDPARNLSLMSELMAALGTPQFSLAYQPKYDLRLGRVTGVEALSRWRHPDRGFVSPDLFVVMAEETGHIREMTDWVLDRALADQGALADAGLPLDMSVNLSGRLLTDDSFMSEAIARLADRAGPMCLEITETAVIANPDAAKRNIERLAKAGVTLSIDDYGSGLSSLAYLRDIPAHELKIDKAFVMRMDEDAKSALLVRSTVDMGHSLGLKVTAEGVETATAQALLAGMGCDLAQGYYIARPLALDALEAFLREAPAADTVAPVRAVAS